MWFHITYIFVFVLFIAAFSTVVCTEIGYGRNNRSRLYDKHSTAIYMPALVIGVITHIIRQKLNIWPLALDRARREG
jgi:uncharacterized membrane protein